MIKFRFVVLLLFSTLTLAAQQPSQVKDLEKKRKAALADIQLTDQLLNENKKTTGNALYRLNLLTQQINSRKEVIILLNKEIESIEKDIQLKELTVRTLERELKLKKDVYAESLRKMYAHKNNQDKLLFVLSASDFIQSYRRIMYLKEYSSWQKKKAEEIISKQKIVKTEKAELLKSKDEKIALLDTRKTEEEKLVLEESAQKEEIQSLKKEQKNLQSELNQKKKQAEALNRQIEKIIAEEIARSQQEARAAAEAKALAEKNKAEKSKKKPAVSAESSEPDESRSIKSASSTGYLMTKEENALSSNFANNKGVLPFPVKGNYKIVGHFGQHQHPDLPKVTINNHGIDIQTTPGNIARAIFDGTITAVFEVPNCPDCKTSVIIRHGNYLSLYSKLEEVYVKSGDQIKTNQNIGKIYTDREGDNSTILHFEIRKENNKNPEKLNPESWLSR